MLLMVGAAIIFYIIIGYPLLLAMLGSRSAPAIAKDLGYQPSVTVILAVYNGAAFIRAKLETLLDLDYPMERVQILVVSDGSTDGTEEVVREFAGRGVTLLAVPHGGKAAAVNHALARATGDILFFTDVRQPLDRMALRHLAANFADPTAGAVTGELRLLSGKTGEQADMDLYWRYELWARRQHSRIDSMFNTTGCIYAMRRELAAPIPVDTLTDDAVLPLRAFVRGYRVIFDPLAIAYDYPALSGTEFRRRFRTLAGLWQVYTRVPQLWTRSRMRFHFLSHKFARLVLPWAVLLVAAATIALPGSSFRTSLLEGEGALVALALLDSIVPAGFPLKRLTSPARTFAMMNFAAAASAAVFFIPASRLWVPTRVEKAGGR